MAHVHKHGKLLQPLYRLFSRIAKAPAYLLMLQRLTASVSQLVGPAPREGGSSYSQPVQLVQPVNVPADAVKPLHIK